MLLNFSLITDSYFYILLYHVVSNLSESLMIEQDDSKGCECPPGFKGDGVHTCEGIVSLDLSN
jgi:hypothetical protein